MTASGGGAAVGAVGQGPSSGIFQALPLLSFPTAPSRTQALVPGCIPRASTWNLAAASSSQSLLGHTVAKMSLFGRVM